MAIHLRRPSQDDLAALLERAGHDHLTYAPAGASLTSTAPPGLRRHAWTTELPHGTFAAARRAIAEWEVHRRSGLDVLADGPVRVGVNVAMAAPLPRGYVDITCRVVEVIDDEDRSGFAYGTLTVHPERGEESFVVTRHADDTVTFDVVAVSAPVHPLARLSGPVADRLQGRAVGRYLTAMRAIVGG